MIAEAAPELARRVAKEPGALPTLGAALAAGGDPAGPSLQEASTLSAWALAVIAEAAPDLARRVAEAPGARRALIAAVNHGGSTAVQARRAVVAIKTWAESAAAAARRACGYCGRRANRAAGLRLRVCEGCNKARFCNTECQRHAWSSHKAACRVIAATSGGNGGA